MAKGYKHLIYEQRVKIEAYLLAGLPRVQIYNLIGCSRSTLYREIKRGLYEHKMTDWTFETRYSAQKAQADYDEKAAAKGPQLKIGNDFKFVRYIENKIVKDKHSPYAAVQSAKNAGLQFKGMVSDRTIYNYIDSGDIFQNVTRESLWMKGKRKRNYDKIKAISIKKPLRRSIEERPKEINKRSECGHWEMDTVIGKAAGKNEVLLVLTERKSRNEIVRKIAGKTQAAVVGELDKLEREHGRRFCAIFKTITIDNGSEFLDDTGIERSIYGGKRTTAYFCHPYNSCERGSNENQNKMIRRFIPKGEDINQYSHEYVAWVESWINNYPRRKLGGKTSAMLFREEMGIAGEY